MVGKLDLVSEMEQKTKRKWTEKSDRKARRARRMLLCFCLCAFSDAVVFSVWVGEQEVMSVSVCV